MLDNVSRSQIVKWVGYYMIIVGIIGALCGPLAALAGGLSFIGGAIGAGTAPLTDEAAGEIAAASGGLMAAGGMLAVLGIVGLVTGVAMLIVGIGLLQRRSWARMGVVVVVGIDVVISVLQFLSGAGAGELVWVIVGGFIVYLFYTDPGIKAELGA